MVTDLDEIINMKIMVSNELINMGLCANIRGYHYLREAIIKTIENPRVIEHITRDLYEKVAKQFKTSKVRLDTSMRYAIKQIWNRGRIDQIEYYFGINSYYCFGEKGPKSSEFIATVAEKMRNYVSVNGIEEIYQSPCQVGIEMK